MSKHSRYSSSGTNQERRAPSATTDPQPTNASNPTREQIAARAYEIFVARGMQDGRADEDWYQAERELRLGRQ